MPTCTSCGSSSIETDHARGSAVCTQCGMVLEDNIILAEVSFMDNDKGVARCAAKAASKLI
jgi:transcription factor IIIB 90 kDa subunit